MPLNFGIDLGTSNTVITCVGASISMRRDLSNWEYELLRRDVNMSIIPFYYEGFRPEFSGSSRVSYVPCSEKESGQEYNDQAVLLKEIRRKRGLERDEAMMRFRETNAFRCSMPSVVYRRRVGETKRTEYINGFAREVAVPQYRMYAGKIARDLYDLDQENGGRAVEGQVFFENTKVMMDQEGEYVGLTPADISGEILAVCFRSIMAYVKNETPLNQGNYRIGISYPVAQNGYIYRENLKRAVQLAKEQTGLPIEIDHIELIQEPYAALLALHYDEFLRAVRNPGDPHNLIRESQTSEIGAMVIDIGGGTTDVALLPIRYRGLKMPSYPESVEVNRRTVIRHAVNPEGAFGGFDFDTRIKEGIARLLDSKLPRPVQSRSNYTEWLLRRLAVNVKHNIGGVGCYRQNVRNYTSPTGNNMLELEVTQDEFDAMVMPLIDGTYAEDDGDYRKDRYGNHMTITRIIRQTLQDAHVDESRISQVFVTGGMSKLPQIQRKIREIWEDRIRNGTCDVRFSEDPLGDISRGVALYVTMCAAREQVIQSGKETDWENGEIRLGEIVPAARNALGVFADCGEGMLTEIIPCGSRLTVRGGRKDGILRAGDSIGVSIQLYSGRSPYDQNLRLLKRYKAEFAPDARPRIDESISVCYQVNEDMDAALSLAYRDERGHERVLPLDPINICNGQEERNDRG